MGGYRSGRRTKHKTEHDYIKIDCIDLRANRYFSAQVVHGEIVVNINDLAERIAINRKGDTLTFCYRGMSKSVHLEELPCLRGRRTWAACPVCLRRCRCLYLDPGGSALSCRICLNLRYQSQRRSLPEKSRVYEAWLLSQDKLWALIEYSKLDRHYLQADEVRAYIHTT